MPRRVTLADVAAHAGVSRATASLVLRETGRVSEATRQRVHGAMAELGYVYNRGAAALRRQEGDTIGVVVTNPRNPFFGERSPHSRASSVMPDTPVCWPTPATTSMRRSGQ